MASESVNKIVKNTLYLYLQQAISLVISFFTVGVTLEVLGVSDYGISCVVGGAVSMFSFLTGTMAVGNQRFYSFYIGTGEKEKLRKVVGSTFFVYIILMAALVILCETIGLWLLNHKLVIPPERMFAANVVFQVGVVSMGISLLQAPFLGLITAHENMSIYAKMSVWDSVSRLLYLYLLLIIPFDKLILYSVLGMCIGLIGQAFYMWYCFRKYPESHTGPVYDKLILRELLGFNVWNLCGNFAWMLKNQGTGMLLNVFFGPAINAAQSIAGQVRGFSSIFANGLTTSVKPQITKNYASGEHDRMFRLTYSGGKITYVLMAVVVIPAIFNIGIVLDLWLPVVPEYAVVFCQLMLIEVLIEEVGRILSTITQATGKIRNYQLIIGFLGALNIPVSFVFLKLGFNPAWVFAISIVCQLGVNAVRVIYLRKVKTGAVKECLRELIIPCGLAALASGMVCFMFPSSSYLPIAVPVIILEIGVVLVFGYFIAFGPLERMMVKDYMGKIARYIKRTK